jgi:hypothetical protein
VSTTKVVDTTTHRTDQQSGHVATLTLRALEDENRRLKLLVAELSLGGEALKAVL